jgi:hypothetical protein
MIFDKPVTKEELKKIAGRALWIFLLFIISIVILYYVDKLHKYENTDLKQNELTFREGDIIFQKSTGKLSNVIEDITGSPLTNCGLIDIDNKGEIFVLNAGEKVEETPLKDWIHRGVEQKFALLRDADLNEGEINGIISIAKKYLDKPFDSQCSWDENIFYFSWLIFEVYKKGANVEICPYVKIQDLAYKKQEDYLRKVFHGKIPLKKEVVTPINIYHSKKLRIIYSDFE